MSRSEMIERAWIWIAWRLPRRLVEWCAIRVVAYACMGRYDQTIVPELTAMDAVKRWDEALAR